MRLRILFLFLCFTAFNVVFSQNCRFNIKVLNYVTDKKEQGATVTVYDGSNVVTSAVSNASGAVNIVFPVGKTYKIEISKPGKVTRFLMVNVTNVNDETLQGGEVGSGMDVRLFDEMPNVDYSYVTSNPITTFSFKGEPNLVFDEATAMKMKQKIDKIIADAGNANKQKEADYNNAIKLGDALFIQKKYKEANAEYEKASQLMPTNPYPAQKIAECDGLLKAQANSEAANAQLEQDYQNLVNAGNALRDQKKYAEAIAKYNEALTKKQEQGVKDQVAFCQSAIEKAKSEAENKSKYDAAMTAANSFYTQKSWMAAKDKFKEALKYIPNDPTATAKLAEIETKLNAQKAEQEQKAKYQTAVDAGDALLAQEKFAEAKAKYQEALAINSDSQYPVEKIKECDTKLAEISAAKAKEEQITKLLAEGNTAFTSAKWADAKTKYNEVLKLDAANAVAKGRITEIDAKMAEEAANAAKIAEAKKLETEGDALAKTNKYKEALAKYNQAQATYTNPAVAPKIEAMNTAISAEDAKAAKKAEIDKLLAEGDAALTTEQLETAKGKYEEVLKIDATNAAAKTKIAEVDKKMAAKLAAADKAQKYAEAMQKGNEALSANDLALAKSSYQAAVALDNTKAEAKDQLAKVEKMLADNATAAANKAKYEAAVKAGNDFQAAGKLTEAKAKFVEAKGIDPTQTLPTEKITEIDALLADQNKTKQIETLLAEGNTAFGAKKYTDAKAKYNQVLALDANNATATAKLKEVNDAEALAAQSAQNEAKFTQLKTEGLALMAQQKYVEAKGKFEEAKTVKQDAEIDKKIAECDAKLAEQAKSAEAEGKYNEALTAAKNLEAAGKLTEAVSKYNEALGFKNTQEPKDRIAAINAQLTAQAKTAETETKYNEALTAAKGFEAAGKLNEAIAKYNEALKFKNEQEPKDRIAALTTQLAAQNAEANKTKQIEDLISAGNTAMTAKKYAEAKAKYNQALQLDPTNAIASVKLAEIEKILKDEQAAAQAANQAAEQAAQNELRFNQLKNEGVALMGQQKYQEAIAKLNEAKVIKTDADVDKKIAECNAKIAELANQQQQQQQQDAANKAKEEQFNALVEKGDAAVAQNTLVDAIKFYEQALAIKQDAGVAQKLADAKVKNEKATVDAEDAQYQKILAVGQTAINEKNYDKAIEMYNRALKFKPNDELPKQKLAEIEQLKKAEADAAAKLLAYNKKVAEAEGLAKANKLNEAIAAFEQAKNLKPDETLPQNRINELTAQLNNQNVGPSLEQLAEEKYQAAMKAGNDLASAKNYTDAIGKYTEALTAKPNDASAKAKIAEMKQILENQAKAAAANKKMTDALAEADKLFGEKQWLNAKKAYDNALSIDGSNAYAKNQIKECEKQLDAERTEEEKKAYDKIIQAADNNFNNTDYKKARGYYERALTFRPNDPYPKKKLAEIEALLNPKKVEKKNNPPVVVQNNSQPQPLPSLGNQTDNSLTDAQKRLQEAQKKRLARKGNRLNQLNDSTVIAANALTEAQLASTTDGNQKLASINKRNGEASSKTDINSRENNAILDGEALKIEDKAVEDNGYEYGEHLDQKAQLEVQEKTVAENAAKGTEIPYDNTQVVKNTNDVIVEKNGTIGDDDYKQNIHSDQGLTTVRIQKDAINLEDFEERKAVEYYVKDVQDKSVDDKEASEAKEDASLDNMSSLIVTSGNQVADKKIEDSKQAPLNHDELKVVQNTYVSKQTNDDLQRQQTMLEYQDVLVQKEQVVIAFESTTGVKREANVGVLTEQEKIKSEQEREGYNQLYEKTLTNKTVVNKEVVVQDEYSKLPSIVTGQNTTSYQAINNQAQERSSVVTKEQEEKHLSNQNSLNTTAITVQKQEIANTDKPKENQNSLKQIQQNQGDIEKQQAADKQQQMLEAKAVLAAIEKKEIKYDDKVANDLGKLYPEGVSQEQFDQVGEDGLVSAVVTRRIVVKNGHGDIFIRTQTLSGITYSKNGQATTETTWQRETQDAKLKRNY